MTGTPWAWGQPEAAAEIACGGALHRVVWRWGRLVALDHDLSDERALVALGGEPCPCLEAFDAFSARLGAEDRTVRRGQEQQPWGPKQLGPALDRVRLRRRLRTPAAERALRSELLAAVTAGLGASVKPWRQPTGPKLSLAVTPLEGGEDPSVEAQVGRGQVRLGIAVPVAWLLEVDRRGLAAAAGGFTLAVRDANRDGTRVAVTSLRWTEELIPEQWSGWLGPAGEGWAEIEGPPVRGGLWWAVRTR